MRCGIRGVKLWGGCWMVVLGFLKFGGLNLGHFAGGLMYRSLLAH